MLENSRVFFSLLFFPVTVSGECFNLFKFILRDSVGLLSFFFGILHWELVRTRPKLIPSCTISLSLFCSLVSHHPRQARQIKAKEAEIIGLWNGLKVSFNPVFCFNKDERE